jgi:hypothetical protein
MTVYLGLYPSKVDLLLTKQAREEPTSDPVGEEIGMGTEVESNQDRACVGRLTEIGQTRTETTKIACLKVGFQ